MVDSAYVTRMVSFFDFSSRETHSSVNDSRAIPFNDCVTIFGADSGGADEAVGDGVVIVGTVGGAETKDPSGFVSGGTGFNIGVDGIDTGDERVGEEAGVVGVDEFDDVEALVGVVCLVVSVSVESVSVESVSVESVSAGSGASTFRLRSSVDPPQAETRRSAASTRVKRFEFIFETLFRIKSYFWSNGKSRRVTPPADAEKERGATVPRSR
jgi:hypothetical protein